MHGGYSTVHGHHVIMHLKDHEINIPIDSNRVNLPVTTYFFAISKEKEKFGPQLRSNLDHYDIRKLNFFGDFITRENFCVFICPLKR